jgi:hypothetical protein
LVGPGEKSDLRIAKVYGNYYSRLHPIEITEESCLMLGTDLLELKWYWLSDPIT